jgi:YD repeat-containing protein
MQHGHGVTGGSGGGSGIVPQPVPSQRGGSGGTGTQPVPGVTARPLGTGASRPIPTLAAGMPGVSLGNGQLTFTIDLMALAALGQSAWSLDLNYLSGAGLDSLLGIGFNFTQGSVLSAVPGGVQIVSGANSLESFTALGSGQYSSAGNNTSSTLVRHNIGLVTETFTLTSGDGTVATYSGINSLVAVPGRLVASADRYGNTQSFTWATAGGVAQLTSVTDGYGRTVKYSYYGSEYRYKLQQATDYLGRQANFQYDSAGHLVAAVLPSINKAVAGNGFLGGTAYVFQYDVNNPRPQRQNDLIAIWYPNEVQPYLNAVAGSTGFRTVDTASVYASATPRYQISYGQDPTDADMWGRVSSVTAGGNDSGVGGTASYIYTSNPADLPTNITNAYDPIVFRAIATDRNGNQSTFDFNSNGMPVRIEQLPTRNKLTVNNTSFQSPTWVTWNVYGINNLVVATVFPEGNSVEYTYENGTVPNLGTPNNFYAPRVGLLLTETHLPGNNYNVPASRAGSGGQTMLTRRYFYDPIFNQRCAMIEERGNPVAVNSGVNVYYTPQNGTAAPTDANRSAYATIIYFDYQKNQTATITNNAPLQSLLGLTATQIQTLISYVNTQMTNTTGAGGIPAGFQTNLGDINGDGTGDGTGGAGPQESTASPMLGNLVKIQHPSATVIGSSSITSQTRIELFTVNARGQTTTHTDGEGNITVYVRYPENDPNGDGTINSAMSSQQYGQLREVHVDADPSEVMSLIGASGDLANFNQSSLITRTNTPGIYQDLITRFEGDNPAATGCVTCAYDPLGNPTAVTDPRGFTTVTERNEVGGIYRVISPAPYNFITESYFDANGNVTRTDTQDQQVQFDSTDPTSPDYGQFTPTGSGSTAHAPMVAGPGGTVRPGWFTNLYTYNILDWKTQDDIDATGSNPSSLTTTYSFDPNGNLIQITKPEGNIVEYDHDERNIRIAQRVGYTAINPSVAAVTIYITDNNGNSLAVIGPADRGTVNNSLTATIADAFSDGTSLVHTGDWSLMNTIDGFNRVTQAMDAVGGYTAFTYDPGSRPIETGRYGTIGGITPIDRP